MTLSKQLKEKGWNNDSDGEFWCGRWCTRCTHFFCPIQLLSHIMKAILFMLIPQFCNHFVKRSNLRLKLLLLSPLTLQSLLQFSHSIHKIFFHLLEILLPRNIHIRLTTGLSKCPRALDKCPGWP